MISLRLSRSVTWHISDSKLQLFSLAFDKFRNTSRYLPEMSNLRGYMNSLLKRALLVRLRKSCLRKAMHSNCIYSLSMAWVEGVVQFL